MSTEKWDISPLEINDEKGIRPADFSAELDRFGAKYIMPRQLVEPIKDFIRPFCEMDTHCAAGGQYSINTLQLDNPAMSLHRAKEREASTM